MATMVISSDQDAIRGEVYVAAPIQRVFQALTDPRQLAQWWGQKGLYHIVGWKGDVRPGGQWRSDGVRDKDGTPFHVSGEYVEVDPPRLVSFTWIASWSGPAKTLVRWELEPSADGTLVKLSHTGFAGMDAATKGHYEGWIHVVGWMQAFVEKGETAATRPELRAPSSDQAS